jgi:CBS domain-containing protein
MREKHIRHLPVLDAATLVGILSERDVYLHGRLVDLETDLTVEDAMTVDVYAASCDDSLDAVVDKMAEHKYGRRGIVEGIFTTVDGMQVLADVLRRATA